MPDLTPSLENYLEAIYIKDQEEKVVRVKDVVNLLNVKPASVINALRVLSEKGLIVHERYGYIEFTQKGVKRAKRVYDRHKNLIAFFRDILGIDSDTAVKDACQVEHYIGKETMGRIDKFIEYIKTCPEGEPQWLSRFQYFVKHGKHAGRR